MRIVVQKFGGTSVGDVDKIKKVANIIAAEKAKGSAIIAVVSAMAGVTNQLVSYANRVSTLASTQSLTEYDSIVASGEQVTAGLLALSLESLGIRSRSFLGWQLPIITDGAHANGKILSIGTENLYEALKKDEVPVIAGFQGVYNERIVTLGRGGSDTTAVAVAAATCATRCDIFTDVTGVFTADPRVVPKAKKIDKISYSQMLVMATAGAKVIHPRAVDISLSHNLETQILSTFSDTPGTILVRDNKGIERGSIIAIISDIKIAPINLRINYLGFQNLCLEINQLGIPVDFSYNDKKQKSQYHNLTICISRENLPPLLKLLDNLKINFKIRNDVAKISVIGNGLSENTIIMQKIFQILAENAIDLIEVKITSSVISLIVESRYNDYMVAALHTSLGLDT